MSFLVTSPCPQCGNQTVEGLRFVNEHGQFMHSKYYCTFWPTGFLKRCGWTDWIVPEPKRTPVPETLTIEEADAIRWDNDETHPQVIVLDESKHRWYTKQLVVYYDGEKLRGFYYLDPATEDQDGQDCWETDPVQTFPVDSHEEITTVYEVAK